MSTTRALATIRCDRCGTTKETSRTTTAGARGEAKRAGWRTSQIGDGYHVAKASSDPDRHDLCPACAAPPGQPKVGEVLL